MKQTLRLQEVKFTRDYPLLVIPEECTSKSYEPPRYFKLELVHWDMFGGLDKIVATSDIPISFGVEE